MHKESNTEEGGRWERSLSAMDLVTLASLHTARQSTSLILPPNVQGFREIPQRPARVRRDAGLGCHPEMYSKGGKGGSKGGGGGVGWDTPPPWVIPMVPAEGGPKTFKLKSSWHRRRRSICLAVSLKHWKGRWWGGGGGGGTRPRYLIVCLWRRLLASHHCSF